MSDRRLICEAAFGFGPFDTIAATDWVELLEAGKPRLRAADWSIGRDNELDHFPPGTATVVLSNRDRALDPDNASSPHAGDLLPNVPVRLRSQQVPFTVTAWARSGGLVFLTLDASRPPPEIGTTIVVNVTDNTFDGTFTITGYFGYAVLLYAQAGADVTNTPGSGTATEIADEFYGFVRGGWEQQLAPYGTGDCRLELIDLLGVLGGYTLPDVFTYQLRQVASLVGLWELNEASVDESVPDLSGNGHDGHVVGDVTFGERGIAPGHKGSALFEAKATAFPDRPQSYIDLGNSPIFASTTTSAIVVTFKYRTLPSSSLRMLFVHGNGNASPYGRGIAVYVDTAADQLFFLEQSTGIGGVAKSTAAVTSGGHIVIASQDAGVDSVALDSAVFDSTTAILGIGSYNGVAIGGGVGVVPEDHWDGWIGTVAIYDAAMALSDRQAVVAAYSKLSGETSDVHIAWALDRLGVPAARRNLDVGTVTMGTADTDGVDALQWMRDVTSTEGGELYIDHRDAGKVRFTNRYHRHLSSRSVTSQATFTDDPAASPVAQIRYPPEGLDIVPNGIDGIINQTQVTWRDGTVLVEDTASIAAYGPRPRQLDTQATTAGQARSAGEWVVANYAQPRSRIRGATASDGTFANRHDKVQALRLDDRITFRVQPLKIGAATTVTLFVDGISHSCPGGSQSTEWRTSFRYAPGNTFSPWVWGTSAWNTTAFWG